MIKCDRIYVAFPRSEIIKNTRRISRMEDNKLQAGTTKEDTISIKKVLLTILFFTPLVLGTIGYYSAFEKSNFLHAFYCAISLYVLNLGSDATNVLIHIARFGAALATSAVVLNRFSKIIKRIAAVLIPLSSLDVTVVYTDSDKYDYLDREKGCIVSKDKIFIHCPNQILMFDDFDNLDFYEKNRHDFELVNRTTYMLMEDIDPYMLKNSNIRYFSINDTIARKFWMENNLCDFMDKNTGEVNCKIAIIGFSQLGKHIFRQAILNNIYSLNQKIEYHVWGDNGLFESQHDDWNAILMNNDSCIFEGEQPEDLCKLKDIDRIIITDENMISLAQMIMSAYPEKAVYFYSSRKRNLEERLVGNLHEFGDIREVVTLDNIKSDKLYKAANELNEDYNINNPDNACSWENLDGFTKGSNIAPADYHAIRLAINKKRNDYKLENYSNDIDGEGPKLEHIRWCRYHYLNNWKYGEPDDKNKSKDRTKKIHKYLQPYDKLDKEIQQNDVDNILTLYRIFETKG